MPCSASYRWSWSAHSRCQMPCSTHSWKRWWQVEPEPNSLGTAFHWQPVRSTYRMPSSTRRKGTIGRPGVPSGFSGGRSGRHSSHRSSGMRQMVGSASGSYWLGIAHLLLARRWRKNHAGFRIGTYVMRMLEVPALFVRALWLKDDDGEEDYFRPLS